MSESPLGFITPGADFIGPLIRSSRTSTSVQHAIIAFRAHGFQLIYLRHFQTSLTILWNDNSLGLDSLAKLTELGDAEDAGDFLQNLANSIDAITLSMKAFLELLGNAIDDFNAQVRKAKRSFHLLLAAQTYLRELSPQIHAMELSMPFIRLVGLFGDGKLEDIYPKLLKRIQQVVSLSSFYSV